MKQQSQLWMWLMVIVSSVPASAEVSVIERGPHSSAVESRRQVVNSAGQSVIVTNRYATIRNGMNRWDASAARWVACTPFVQTYSDAIVCTGATYSVILNRNLNTVGAVDLEMTTTNGPLRIVSHPLGIGFYDPESGRSVLLAQIRNCEAVVSSNRIIFPDAFDDGGSGVRATATYTYDVGRFAQDIILLTRPVVKPADFQMGAHTRLEVLSELDQCPTPTKIEEYLQRETNAVERARTVEPDLINERIRFSELLMPLGRAFQTKGFERTSLTGIPVAKRLLNVDGRAILVEAIEYREAQNQLETLPSRVSSGGTNLQARLGRTFPETQRVALQPFEKRLAGILVTKPVGGRADFASMSLPAGFLIDYEIVYSVPGYYFVGGETYLIESQVYIDDAYFQSGPIVLKYGSYAGLNISGTIFGPYYPLINVPLIFTSKDDNSIGSVIEGSSGYPGPSAAWALAIEQLDYDTTFSSLDFRYCYAALSVGNSAGRSVSVYTARFTDTAYQILNVGAIESVDFGSVYICNAPSCYPWTYPEGDSGVVSVGHLTDCDGDADNDSLPDAWERQYFGNITSQNGSGDADGDGLSNLHEYESGANPTDPDTDDDGMPDGWEWNHFGDFDETAGGDYDGDGVSNGDEYLFGTDPNTIMFSASVTNQFLSSTQTSVNLDVASGVPFSLAVLVDSTNFAGATWTSYSANPVVNPGSTEGWHEIWIGLRGRTSTSEQTWQWKRVKVDSTPPTLIVTSPASETVLQPMIQLFGYSPEALSIISCALSNSSGVFSNQMILVLDRSYSTNTFEFTTTTFQGFDLALTNGVNTITIFATDQAGNLTTTNFNFTLASDAVAPVVELWWPQDSAQLCGDTFTWRGVVDDFTAVLTATIVDASDNTHTSAALVERDGKFWFEDLPLAEGASSLTLTAEDFWGNVSSTNITVSRSAVQLTIDPVGQDLLNNATITVSGTINVSDHTVWVNGVKATLNVDGTWTAQDVPVNPGGTAVIQARAIPNSDNGGNGSGGSGGSGATMQDPGNPSSAQQKDKSSEGDKPSQLYISEDEIAPQNSDIIFQWDYYDLYLQPIGVWSSEEDWDNYSQYWDDDHREMGVPGYGQGTRNAGRHTESSSSPPWDSTPCPRTFFWPVPDVPDQAAVIDCNEALSWMAVPPIIGEHCDVKDPAPQDAEYWYLNYAIWMRARVHKNYDRCAQTRWKLFTGGKAKPGRQNLWELSGWASEVLDKSAERPFTDTPMWPIANQDIIIDGSHLGADGFLYKVYPDGATKDVTARVDGVDFCTFGVGAVKYKSHFEVFVRQPWPDLSFQPWSPDPPPLGWPAVNGTDAGHAWWKLSNEAPISAINQFTTPECSQWINREIGYAPVEPSHYISIIPPIKEGVGYLSTANGTPNIVRTYAIGFQGPGLIDGLRHVQRILPSTWNSDTHNCVHEVVYTGGAAGTRLPGSDPTPEGFGFALPPSDP